MSNQKQRNQEKDEPTREQWRGELLQRMDAIGGVEGMRFIVQQCYRRLDAPVLKDLIDTVVGDLLVNCGGTLYRYDREQGVYEEADDWFRTRLADLGADLREERRLIDLDLGTLPKGYEDDLQSLLPRLQVDSRWVTTQADCLKLLYDRPGAVMDGDPTIANMRNGLLDRMAMKLLPHTPGHLSSIQLPYEFDPSARCPLWLRFLEQVQPDAAVRELLQEFVGYTLVPTTKFEAALVVAGKGGTGKGTFTKVTQRMVGEANCSDIALDRLGERFMTERLRGKLLNVCPEVDASKPIDEGMFKSLVSGDRRMVERKYKDPEPMVSFARIIMPTNGLPNIKDPTNAFFDRLFIANFDQQFRRQVSTDDAGASAPDADPDLLEKLTAELPGIFNWAVEGMQRLFERGRFAPPASMLANARAYRDDQNPVFRFIDQFSSKGEGRWIDSGTLYQEYQSWCVSEGIKHPFDKGVFCKRVVQLSYPGIEKKDRTGGVRGFSGLGTKLDKKPAT